MHIVKLIKSNGNISIGKLSSFFLNFFNFYSSGLALIGSLNLNSGFASLTSKFTVNQEPKLILVSDIDFSSEILLCMQLSSPQTLLR